MPWTLLLHWTSTIFRDAGFKSGVRFVLRTMLWPRLTVRWLLYIHAHPERSRYAGRRIDIVQKIHRPYLSSRFTLDHVYAALTSNYRFVDESPCRNTLWQALRGELPGIPCGVNDELTLHLRASRYPKEGEFELCLENAPRLRLAALTFAVITVDGERAICAAGLQGPPPDGSNHEQVKSATASLGRTPLKLFLGRACLAPAKVLEVQAVWGIDDAFHVYRSRRYHHVRPRIRARYAEIWRALGGFDCGNGFWRMDLPHSSACRTKVKTRASSLRKQEALQPIRTGLRGLLLSERGHRLESAREMRSAPDHLRSG